MAAGRINLVGTPTNAATDSVPATAGGTDVAFVLDHVDEAMSQGWSVFAVGPATTTIQP